MPPLPFPIWVPLFAATVVLLAAWVGMRALMGRSARRRLAASLPDWGEGLGLNHRPGRRPGSLGELNGILEGRRVLVRPDLPAVFVEHPRRIVGLHLGTDAPRGSDPTAPTLGRAGDRLFRTRRFPQPFAAALTAPGGFVEQARDVWRTWGRKLAGLTCDEGQIVARLRGGGLFRGRAWVKTDTFEALIRSLLALSHTLERAVQAESARRKSRP